MKKIIFLLVMLVTLTYADDKEHNHLADKYLQAERGFQEDADLVRLSDLAYWTGLIEDYYQQNGRYPLQNELQSNDDIILVKIATQFQRQYLSVGGKQYIAAMDNNKSGRFNEKTMKQFVTALSEGMNKNIDEHYDIQKVPTTSPIGYNYFVTKDGYLFWVTCITCGVTPISTLLMDGFTPTVNIASDGMVDKVTKAKTRKAMLSDSIYRQWLGRPYHKERYIKQLVEENHHDAK